MPSGPEIKATVVVVTYNGAHLLPACLDALERQTLDRRTFEVVVVDNGSSDGTAEIVRHRYPGVRLIEAGANLGFAAGNNLALRRVTAPFAVLINNDARPAADFLERIVVPFDAPGAGRVAAVTAKVLFAEDGADGRPMINSTGNLIGRDGRGFDRDFGRVDGGPPAERVVFGFYGGASALRMQALRAVGGFDDDLFLYFEDTDLSWRLRSRGWEIWYEPTAVARHLYAASSDPASPFFVYQQARNMLIVFTRHAPAATATWVALRFLIAAPWRALRELPDLRRTHARLMAFGAYLKRLPRVLRERRRIWRDAPVPRRELAGFLEPRKERGRRTGGSAAPSRGPTSER
ncbi:MAG: glycosyltransferase family 2 protein [Acidimicrobiales bacterium]